MSAPEIRFVEVGPRDGLQNEAGVVPLEAKVDFIDALSATGIGEIEVGAFVSPTAVPQMKDTEAVLQKIKRTDGVTYSALVPNEKGLERALACKVDKIAVFTAASETFNQKNIKASIKKSIERFRPVIDRARSEQIRVRGYISTAFHCPFEGKVAPQQVVDVAEQLLLLGVEELSIGDTLGKASPRDVRALLDALLHRVSARKLFLHFHDTYGMAVANALTAWREFGITGFDASAGGLGGCPYAPGASGNVATEDLAFAFASEGAATGIDSDRLQAATALIEPMLGHPPASHLGKI